MKSLAELKRAIKPGVRLRCIENTYRPELNGKSRVVVRVQTNAFTWKHETGPSTESWTNYEKASAYTFPGGNTFSFLGTARGGQQHTVTLEILS